MYQFSSVIFIDDDATISNNVVMHQIREQIDSRSPVMRLEDDVNGEVTTEIVQNDSFLASVASKFFPYFRLYSLFSTFLGRYFHDQHYNAT